jgi:hypothetical protein
MGLGRTISEWIRIIRDAFDFGPEFPAALAAQRARVAEELTQVRHQLEEARKACREKDELIAKLQAPTVKPAPKAPPTPGTPARQGCAPELRVADDVPVDKPVCSAPAKALKETPHDAPTTSGRRRLAASLQTSVSTKTPTAPPNRGDGAEPAKARRRSQTQSHPKKTDRV